MRRLNRSVPFRLVAICGALTFALASCSGEGGSADPAEGGTADPATDANTGGSSPDAGDTMGGTLRYGMYADVAGLDPIVSSNGGAGGQEALNAIYDVLLWIDADGTVEPRLALSLENDSPTTWTMTLREDVEFSDGEPFNAEAVKFNIERHMDPDNSSPHAGSVRNIQEVTAVDEYTVQFTLDSPWQGFPSIFGPGVGWIGSPAAIERGGEEYNMNPVGAGPFVLAEYVPDDHITLTRRDDYHREGLPYLDRIEMRPIPESQARYQSLIAGDIDATFVQDDIAALNRASSEGLEVNSVVGTGAMGFPLNLQRAPLDDIRVRQALQAAIDYEAMEQVAFDGTMDRRTQPFPDHSPFFNDEVEWPAFDPDRASSLIEEYETETGTQASFEIKCWTSYGLPQMVQAAQQMWSAVGIDVTVEMLEFSQAIPEILDHDFDAACWTLTPFPDPDPLLTRYFSPDEPRNLGEWNSEIATAAIEEARGESDPDARGELYGTLSNEIVDDAVWIWVAAPVIANVTSANVIGLRQSYNGGPDFSETRLM